MTKMGWTINTKDKAHIQIVYVADNGESLTLKRRLGGLEDADDGVWL